jgi:hypothetical protein
MVIGVPTASYVVAWWKFVRKEIIADRKVEDLFLGFTGGNGSSSQRRDADAQAHHQIRCPLLKLKESFARAMAML